MRSPKKFFHLEQAPSVLGDVWKVPVLIAARAIRSKIDIPSRQHQGSNVVIELLCWRSKQILRGDGRGA